VRNAIGFARRVMAGIRKHYLSLVAAGVAFYGLLAIFPAMIAVVAIYGLVTDPDQIRAQLEPIVAELPEGVGDLVTTQLATAAQIDRGGLTAGALIGLGATLWAAAGGVRALCLGLSMIREEPEARGFVSRAVTALALTIAVLIAVIVALALVAAFPIVLDRLGLDAFTAGAAQVVRWVVLVVLLGAAVGALYRWGPAGAPPQWHWASWGTGTAIVVWILGSVGFSVYVSNFGNYNKTYGSLAAVIILMLWLYLSAFAVLLGAEVDAVREPAGRQV
jgi:membrane protein